MALAIAELSKNVKPKTHRYSSTVGGDYKANVFRTLSTQGRTTIRVKVIGVVHRTHKEGFVIKPENFKYDNVFCEKGMVDCDFELNTGDLVDIEGLVPSSEDKNVEIELQNVSPHKISVSEGRILKWNGTVGTISSFADFTISVCQAGYSPKRNDSIVGVFVQCRKGNYEHRAVKVIPLHKGMVVAQEIDALKKMYIKDRREVHVDDTYVVFVDLGASKFLNLNVQNHGYVPSTLRRICRMSVDVDPQVELDDPKDIEDRVIQPGEVITFKFKVTGRELGKSHTHFCWTFDSHQVSRFIEVEVVDMSVLDDLNIETNSHVRKRTGLTASKLLALASSRLIHSNKTYKPSSKCIIQLPIFPLPQMILKAVLPDEPTKDVDILDRVFRTLPCIAQELGPNNYAMQMHGLLFLEEVARIKEIGELELESISFRVEQDKMVLDVPPLSPYVSRLLVGDTIIVRHTDTEKDPLLYEGYITKILTTEMWILFCKRFHKSYIEGDTFNVYFVNNRTTLRRMHQAINLVIGNLGVGWLFPKTVEPRLPQVFLSEFEHRASKRYSDFRISNYVQRKIIMGSKCSAHCGGRDQGSIIETTARLNHPIISTIEKKVSWFNKDLNNEQKEAVINILLGEARPLPYIIFGPPGTGKTDTVVEVVLQLHSMLPESRILVTSPSNSSADLVTERLLGVGYLHHKDILRLVGHHYCEQQRLPTYLAPYSCEPSSNPAVENGEKKSLQPDPIPRVTISTLGCQGVMYNLGLKTGHYTHIIIDEAGQATEPETLIPMTFLDPREGQLILAGDPLQLGPVVTSRVASRQGLEESFLSRILKTPPYHSNHEGYDRRLVTKLTMNYRSLPQILLLSSALFYNNDLVPHVAEDQDCPEVNLLKVLGDGLPCHKSGKSPPLLFHGIQGKSCQVLGSHSWFNPEETVQSILYLRAFYEAGLTPGQVGIITPYQLQVRYIKTALTRLNIAAPKVGSIEEFQGQERMAMIFTTVRSVNGDQVEDKDGQQMISFVAHAQRLNVALSRARAVLIIVGNPYLLSIDKNWRSIIQHCITNNVYLGCPIPSVYKK